MNRSFSVIVIFIALSIVGCALLPLLPVKLAPSQTLPSITVSYSMQGASARTVEQEVTSRIESVLARVAGVKSIDSKSSNGGGRVSVSLDRHADMDNVRFEVSTLVSQIWGDLPEGVSYPNISLRQVDKEGSRPFMTLTLNAPANPAEILSYGEENLKPILSRVKGVGKVELSGAQPMEWKLHYDIDQLSSLGITPNDIRNAISEHYHSEFLGIAPLGKDGDNNGRDEWMRLSMKSMGTADRFMPHEITLSTKDGDAITLDKIVTVSHEESDPTGYFRINGLNSIYVNITSDDDANQLKVSEDIYEELKSFAKIMPAGYMVDTVYDATEEIHDELDKIYFRTGLTVLILLLFVALVSFSIRYVLLITIGLAINLAVAVVFYYLTKIEIQLYSLAGITISLNLIIDNLIVMADHYTRRRNLGAFTSILAATLTTVGALSVVYFMDEKTRLSLQDFVAVVIINLSVSLAVALFLVPALVDRLWRIENGKRKFHLAIDLDKLAKTGITANQLFAAIEPTFGRGINSGSVSSGKGVERIRLYSTQDEEYDIFALMNQPFKVGEKIFKLSDVGQIEKRQTPQSIVKKNQEYVLCLQYEYIGSNQQGERVLNEDLEKINSILPVGYKAENEKNEWMPKDDSAKYWLLLLVMGIIFFSTSILFNSLRQPLAIIFIIPVSFIGVFLIFYLLKLKFDQGGFASFILLAGITVNAAIYILNEYNTLRRQYRHVSARRLYIKAFRIKIVPILLTVLSTILGFIPFIVGESKESFWYPLAIGTMGGLAMSLLALLIIFPIFVLPKNKSKN